MRNAHILASLRAFQNRDKIRSSPLSLIPTILTNDDEEHRPSSLTKFDDSASSSSFHTTHGMCPSAHGGIVR